MSAWFASRILAVSLSVSPFVRLEEAAEILMTSALRRIGGELEGGARARARFDEEIDERLAPQRRDLLDLAGADFFEGIGRIENESDFLGGQLAQAEQVFACPAQSIGLLLMLSPVLNSQTASGSVDILQAHTHTLSRAVGRFFPTIIRPDRQFAVTAIDQGGELNASGPTE